MVSSTGTGASDLAAENMSSMVAGSTKRDMAGQMLVDGRCAEDVDKCKIGDVNAIAPSNESAAKTIINCTLCARVVHTKKTEKFEILQQFDKTTFVTLKPPFEVRETKKVPNIFSL